MSRDWIERVRKSGRFAGLDWATSEPVEVTTLDRLIGEHGLPAFSKIDVDGTSTKCCGGLSHAVPAL